MKLTLKLSKEEALGFKNWSAQVKPDQVQEDEFIKQIFFNGIEFLNLKLQQATREMIQDEKIRAQLETSGINVKALEEKLGNPTPMPQNDGEGGIVYDLKTKQRVK